MTANELDHILRIKGLRHTLSDKTRHQTFTVHVDGELNFRARDFVGLLGPSGCGKTTLLTILGLLRKPTNLETIDFFDLYVPQSGSTTRQHINLKEEWQRNTIHQIEILRRKHIGFALQSGELVNALNVTENIQVPMQLNSWPTQPMHTRTEELLKQFRLTRIKSDEPSHAFDTTSGKTPADTALPGRNAIASSRINCLSGGEYQRVALARSIAHRPSVVFVDEPTSALNRELAHGALKVMQNLQRDSDNPGITFMITHDEDLADRFCNVIVKMAPRKNEPAGEVTEATRSDNKAC